MPGLRPLLLVLLLASGTARAQDFPATLVPRGEVPAEARHRGAVEAARRWTDRAGDNLLLLTRTPETFATDRDGNEVRKQEVHAYHYVRQGAGWRLLWRAIDGMRRCGADLVVGFVPGSLRVTDLDGDGTAETSYLYRMGCMGGVDPRDVKLVMHEGAARYGVQGVEDLRHLGPYYPEPRPRPDAALARAPAFRAFAEGQWRSHARAGENEKGPP